MTRTIQPSSLDVEDIMEWLLNPEDDSLDPMGDFKKVDQLRPKKACRKPEDRAEEIEGALEWMRNKGVKPFDNAKPALFRMF